MIKSIEHIAIAAADPAALAQWYCTTLPFRILIASEASQTYFVGLPDGGILEIIPSTATQLPTMPPVHGLHHVALAVDDFATAAQALQAAGVVFIGPRYQAPDGGTQFDFFTDPEGNRLQLVQRARALGSDV
ncbi:MAG: VOC family protein [Caldilineaceae bacterium]|nr:VOC family protein [Caldilineaceae bacterium]